MKSEVVTDNKMINRLKVVLAEKNRTGKWLAQQLGKMKQLFLDGALTRRNHHLRWLSR